MRLECGPERMNIESVSLMLLGRASHWEGAIYLKARWPFRFVLQFLCPGTARNDSLADRRERDGVYGEMKNGVAGQTQSRNYAGIQCAIASVRSPELP